MSIFLLKIMLFRIHHICIFNRKSGENWHSFCNLGPSPDRLLAVAAVIVQMPIMEQMRRLAGLEYFGVQSGSSE